MRQYVHAWLTFAPRLSQRSTVPSTTSSRAERCLELPAVVVSPYLIPAPPESSQLSVSMPGETGRADTDEPDPLTFDLSDARRTPACRPRIPPPLHGRLW